MAKTMKAAMVRKFKEPLSIEEVRRMSERFAPFENLSAQFLLAGARMAG